jgi:Heterokaryon incompatibility protein (HET)
MKLIRAKTLEIVEILGSDVPPYAILSHTWDPDEEVSYEEMINGSGKQKAGLLKIKQCCLQAVRDGLEWAWADTCCIDKSSSAELTEAINSMFKYYSRAAVCYAFFADVTYDGSPSECNIARLAPYLRNSRWFTRGWTLQELLAPSQVIFFSAQWIPIGDRSQWKEEIADFTKIHYSALSGGAEWLANFSVSQKMSWASSRTTTREEDMAYCLMGLFDVHMPLLYGEGKKAFVRLQEEIMKNSDDQSIFAWENPEVTEHNQYLSLIAQSPSCFQSFNMIPLRHWEESVPYVMTNAGLQLTGVLTHNPKRWGDIYVLCLPVCDEESPNVVVGVPLKQLFGDQYARRAGKLLYFPTSELQIMGNLINKRIYVRKDIISPSKREADIGGRVTFLVYLRSSQQVATRYEESYPPSQVWARSRDSLVISHPTKKGPTSHLDGWSWHVAIVLIVHIDWDHTTLFSQGALENDPQTPTISLSETYRCNLVIGYNGRTHRYGCNLVEISGLGTAESAWKDAGGGFNRGKASCTFSRTLPEHSEDGFLGSACQTVEVCAELAHSMPLPALVSELEKKEVVQVNITTQDISDRSNVLRELKRLALSR